MAHFWHGIQAGVNPPNDVNVMIEIPKGSKCKYELDKVAGIIRVDRIIASAVIDYPAAQVRMAFNAHTKLGEQDTTTIVGTRGTLRSSGPGLNDQAMMQVNMNALVDLTHLYLQGMVSRNSGKVLQVASTAGIAASPRPVNSLASQ